MKCGQFEVEFCEFSIGDFDASRIDASIQFSAYLQSGLRCRVRDQVDDYVVTDQRSPTPILGDVAEYAMLDLVPFAGARREVAHMDRHSQAHRQLLQRHFPKAAPATVAATPVCRD